MRWVHNARDKLGRVETTNQDSAGEASAQVEKGQVWTVQVEKGHIRIVKVEKVQEKTLQVGMIQGKMVSEWSLWVEKVQMRKCK